MRAPFFVAVAAIAVGQALPTKIEAYLFYKADRYDLHGKDILRTNPKEYIADLGIRFYLGGYKSTDMGRLFENAVYLQLLYKGWRVHVGKLYSKEVDFVAKRGSELVYIQVSDDISSESTLERELAPLLSVRDAFPKVLIARTRHEPYTREGVIVLDLARWLLGEQEF